MKILYYIPSFLDYGLDTLFDGLVQLLGPENALEYPHKPVLHGEKQKKLGWYPCFFDHPIVATDSQKIAMLQNNEFDIILIGCRLNTEFPPDEFISLIQEKSKIIPTYLIDQGDESGINSKLIEQFHPRLYFKREFFADQISDQNIVPLSFSYSNCYLPQHISGERTHELFWAGKSDTARQPYLKICQDLRGSPFCGYPQVRYREKLLSNTIGLNLRGWGWDTVRYYEVPAHGMLLFSQKPNIVIENAFKDGENSVMFESPEEMTEKLNYCLKNRSYVDKIRLAGHEWFTRYHTSKMRAKQMIDKINNHK